MVAVEDKQIVGVGVQKIFRYYLVALQQSVAPTFAVVTKCGAHSLLQREVHHTGQVGVVAIRVTCIGLPVCHLRGGTCPALAYDIDTGILVAYGFGPLGDRHFLVVRIGIHAQSINIHSLNPPDCPLLEVFEHVGVVEVHVWHRGVEPTAVHTQEISLRGVRVGCGRELPVRTCECRVLVNPVVVRQIVHPPVCRATMVRHNIHNDFQTFVMGCVDECAVQFVATVARVDMIVVGAGVAVVGLRGFVVQQQRRAPNGCGTQRFDGVQVVNYTLEVSAMTAEPLVGSGFLNGIVGIVVVGVAVGKTVGHNQIDHILGTITGVCARFGTAVADHVVDVS